MTALLAARTDVTGPGRCGPERPAAVPAVLAVLVAANLLNNELAPEAYVPTCVATSVLLLGLAGKAGCGWDDLGLARTGAARGLRLGGVLAATVAAGYAVGARLPATRPLLADRRVAELRRSQVLFRALVRVPLGTVLLEEIAFRGVLYGLLRRRYGTGSATAWSAALFGLWHVLPARHMAQAGPGGPGRPRGPGGRGGPGGGAAGTARTVAGTVAFTGAAGVLFCELRRRGGSLAVPMALHAAVNAFGYLASHHVMRRPAQADL